MIAAELNAKHILTPAQYKVRHNIEKLEKLRGVKWTVDTLSQILKNEVYIGRYVTGKDRVCLYRHERGILPIKMSGMFLKIIILHLSQRNSSMRCRRTKER